MHCSLFIDHCSLFIVHCSLFIVIVNCALFFVHCYLFIVHCALFLVPCSLFFAFFVFRSPVYTPLFLHPSYVNLHSFILHMSTVIGNSWSLMLNLISFMHLLFPSPTPFCTFYPLILSSLMHLLSTFMDLRFCLLPLLSSTSILRPAPFINSLLLSSFLHLLFARIILLPAPTFLDFL